MSEYPRYGHDPIPMRRLGPDFTDEIEAAIPWVDLGEGGRGKRYADHYPFPEALGEFYWNLRDGQRALVVAIPNAAGRTQ